MLKTFITTLDRPSDPRAFALFRILFGLIMFLQLNAFISGQLIEMGLVGPKLLFTYEGFEWLRPASAGAMNALLAALAVASILVMIGAAYRASIVFLFLGFTYVFLLDKGYYNNHYYLFSLLAFLLCWIPANKAWSVDGRIFGQTMQGQIPRWAWLLLRVQVVIVYMYGGIAKLNKDWLFEGEPMRSYLASLAQGSAWSDVITSAPVLQFFIVGGLLFDLLAGPLLWWKRTRTYMLPFVLLFNGINHWLFNDIGVFPFFMLGATVLFFDPEEIASFLDGRAKRKAFKKSAVTDGKPSRSVRGGLGLALAAYLFFQLLFPLRWLFLPGDPDWNGIAQRFSWHMKIHTRKQKLVAFQVEDLRRGRALPVRVQTYINNHQTDLCAFDPGASVRFAHWLKEEVGRRGLDSVRITSRIVISPNGRPYRYLWPPDQDLARVVADRSRPQDWVPAMDAPELELSQTELMEVERLRTSQVQRRTRR